MIEGNIFNIQRYCIHDGPGIRTTVFFKGCQLKCLWCENPESVFPKPQLSYHSARCIDCGKCRKACPKKAIIAKPLRSVDWRKCDNCGICTRTCSVAALEMIGKSASVDEIMKEIEKDVPFYNKSGGGVTVSGGEPTMQFDFLCHLLKALKEKNIHTVVETNGMAKWEQYEYLLVYVDHWYIDVKGIDDQKHIKHTGMSNQQILSNISGFCKRKARMTIRVPVIPGMNASKRDLDLLDNMLCQQNLQDIHIIPYHNYGNYKINTIGTSLSALNMPSSSPGEVRHVLEFLNKRDGRNVMIM